MAPDLPAGVKVPAGVDPNSVPPDEDLGAPTVDGFPFPLAFHLNQIGRVQYRYIAVKLDFRAEVFQAQKLSTSFGEFPRACKNFSPVMPFLFRRIDGHGLFGNDGFELGTVVAIPSAPDRLRAASNSFRIEGVTCWGT